MVAVITDNFKRNIIDQIIDDVDSTGVSYYVAVGRSENWDSTDAAPTPLNSLRDIRNFRLSMQSMKLGEDVSFVIPRHNWSSGTIYDAFDDAVQGYPTNSFYVVTDELQVYICLQQGKNISGIAVNSTIKPTGTGINPITLSDGYVWKYLYSVSSSSANKFQSSNFTPVEFIRPEADSTGLNIQQLAQRTIQQGAVRGQVIGVEIINGGTGYSSAPNVTFTGNGSYPPAATAVVANGSVVNITMNDSGAGKAFGRGYDYASVVLTGGGGNGAKARAVLGPERGIGGDPRDDLKSTSIMFNSKLIGPEGNNFVVGNNFRQVALVKNPLVGPDSGDSAYTGQSANTLRTLKLSAVNEQFTIDKTIQGATSQARGFIDRVDSNRLYFHQSEETGFGDFQEGETVSEIDGSGAGSLDSAGADTNTHAWDSAEVDFRSGDILYIDNRAAITRASDQNEDIKVIIQL